MAKPNIARRLGAFYGLEDGDDAAVAVDGGETPIAEEVSAPVADVAEAAAEVDQQEEVLADMTETAGEVENVETAADAAIEESGDGTLSRESAAWVRIALENAIGKTGMVPMIMPSMEAFGGTSGRRSATKVTMEGIGEFLKKIWNAIKTQMQKVWAYVKNWYLKVLDAAPRLKKKAEAVAKRTENITGAADSKDFDLGAMKQLHLGGKAPAPAEIVAKMKFIASDIMEDALGSKTASGYESTFTKYEAAVEAVVSAELSTFGTTKGSGEGIIGFAVALEAASPSGLILPADGLVLPPGVEKKVEEAKATQDTTVKASVPAAKTGSAEGDRWGEGTTANVSPELPGGKAVFIITPKTTEGKSLMAQARMTRVRLDNLLAKPKEVDSSGTFKTLSSSQIQDICESVKDICDFIIDYKKAWEKRDKYTAKLKSAMDKVISTAEKETPGDGEEKALKAKTKAIKDIAQAQQHIWSSGTSFETGLVNYGLSVSRSALTWCEASISEYKD